MDQNRIFALYWNREAYQNRHLNGGLPGLPAFEDVGLLRRLLNIASPVVIETFGSRDILAQRTMLEV
jgi:hypothetical protein